MAFNPNLLTKVVTGNGQVATQAITDLLATTLSGTPLPPQFWLYQAGSDVAATVQAAGYFNYFADWLNTLIYNNGNYLRVGDLIYCTCDDENLWLEVVSIGQTITTQVAPVTAGAVDTAAIQDGAVTLPKLAAGITPSHVVKYAAQFTTVGGAAAEAIAIPGVLATDLGFVQIKDNGTGNVTALQAACTANTLTVTFSGNPGNDCIIYYQILRAAA